MIELSRLLPEWQYESKTYIGEHKVTGKSFDISLMIKLYNCRAVPNPDEVEAWLKEAVFNKQIVPEEVAIKASGQFGGAVTVHVDLTDGRKMTIHG